MGADGWPFSMAMYLRALPSQTARRRLSNEIPRRLRSAASYSSRRRERRTHARWLQKGVSNRPHIIRLAMIPRCGQLLLMRPETVADLQDAGLVVANAITDECAEMHFDRCLAPREHSRQAGPTV